jgi:hypothetical protein
MFSAASQCRIASIFVILFGASVFGLLTLRFKSADAAFPRLLRAFSGGIILALALVHIIPEVSQHAAAFLQAITLLQTAAVLQAVEVVWQCYYVDTCVHIAA